MYICYAVFKDIKTQKLWTLLRFLFFSSSTNFHPYLFMQSDNCLLSFSLTCVQLVSILNYVHELPECLLTGSQNRRIFLKSVL